MADFYFLILKKLSNGGILKTIDISKETANYLINQSNGKDVVWSDVNRVVTDIFNEFKKNGHIKEFINNTPENICFDSEGKYLSQISISAEISLLGFSFYREYHKNVWVSVRSWIAIGISILAAIFTGWSVMKSSNDKPLRNAIQLPVSSKDSMQTQKAKKETTNKKKGV